MDSQWEQWLSRIAHDFNNLLTAMALNLEAVKRCLTDRPELDIPLRNLDQLLSRMKTTNRQLLEFGRHWTVNPRPLELHQTLEQSLGLVAALLGESIDVFFVPNRERYWIAADPTLLDHAILNVCYNARDAMPKGGVLTVSTHLYRSTVASNRFPEVPPGEFIEVRFADTGHGIAPEHLPRVFEPFFTTKEKGRGSGLGLASVYGGARQHGGWAEISSAVGHGTALSLFLPRIETVTKEVS